MDVDKKRKRKKKKNIVKVNVAVFFFMDVFYDKDAKIKEEFNVLICSQLRIMNLHARHS